MQKKREIVLDVETTGLDAAQGDRIIEIGCVEIIDYSRTGRFFHSYVNPGREISAGAFKVHGISAEFLKDKPDFAAIAGELVEFIGDDSALVIHNAPFDMGFLDAEFASLGLTPIPRQRVVDTLAMARRKFPGAQASLDALCRRFGVDASSREKHGALLDAGLLADIYPELLGLGKQKTLAFAESVVSASSSPARAALRYRPREFAAPAPELAAHEAFIAKSVQNAMWLGGASASAILQHESAGPGREGEGEEEEAE